MDIFKKYATDEKLEEDGTWTEIGPKTRLLVARLGNPRYRAAFKRLSRPYQAQIDRNSLPEEIQEQILIKSLAETVLLGWEGLEEGGQPLAYSKETALRLLTDLKDFRDDVLTLARQAEAYRVQALEDAVKN